MNLQASLKALGYTGTVLALRMGVCGDGKVRRVNAYSSAAASAIAAEVAIAQACGVSGFVHIWDGTVDGFINSSMQGMWAACQKSGLKFCVMLDQWIARNQKPDPTTATIDQIKSEAFQAVLNSSCYIPEKFLLEFNLGPAGVNLAELQVALPGLKILSENSGYSWPQIPPKDSPAHPVMALCPQFQDGGRPVPNGINGPWPAPYERDYNNGYWGGGTFVLGTKLPPAPQGNPSDQNRTIDHQGGNYWMDQLAGIPKDTPYLMIATWDDFEEQTAVLHILSAMCAIRVH